MPFLSQMIVLHNPHKIWFKETLSSFRRRTRAVHKYDYMLEWLLDQDELINVYVDSSHPTDIFHGLLKVFSSNMLEFKLWTKINNFPISRFKIHENIMDLQKDDILFSFAYGHFNYADMNYLKKPEVISGRLRRARCKKVFHLSHFGYNTGYAAKYSNSSGVSRFVSEANLRSTSKIFNEYFNWYEQKVIVLPFVPEKRFQSLVPFNERRNIALAMGTITYPIDDDNFRVIYPDGVLQPMRNLIHSNKDNISSFVDCQITSIKDYGSSAKGDKENKYFQRIRKFLCDDFNLITRIFYKSNSAGESQSNRANEREYYKKDIVRIFNNYRMFVVPEEVIGLPGIGFVEGMACGCAYVGLNSPIYKDYGMEDKKHYIAYDGSIKDLVDKIAYYQKNVEELEVIALAGRIFADKNFNKNTVVSKFMTTIEEI